MSRNRQDRRFIVVIIASVLSLALAVLITVNSQKNNESEMPYVILGGMPIYVEYSGESLVYAENYEDMGYLDYFEPDFTPVQIGEIPILCNEDLQKAFSLYYDSYVQVKEIKDGKLFKKTRYMAEESVHDEFVFDSNTGAKVCFISPEINRGFSFAHPLCAEQIHGLVFNAQFESLAEVENELNIYVQKKPLDNPDIIGHITGQNLFGVSFSYDPNKFDISYSPRIQIAKRSEVKLGPAQIYTDFGEGLNLYDVEVTSLDEEEYDHLDPSTPMFSYNSNSRKYISSSFQKSIDNNRFAFVIKDNRMIEKGIISSIGGMSGSPVIQNGKLIGFNGYGYEDGGLAVYAEVAYEAFIDSYAYESISYTPTYSQSNHPIVVPGQYPIKFYVKGIGAIVNSINTSKYDIKPGDRILALDNHTVFNSASINELLAWYREYGYSQVEATIERDNKIFEVFIEPSEDLDINCFVYYFINGSAISMIDPFTFRYATGAKTINSQPIEVYSGITVKSSYDYDPIVYTNTIVSENEVVGTLTDASSCFYGFYEPFNFKKEGLFEIAFKNEIKNGKATVYLFDGDYGELPVDSMDVMITCENDYLVLECAPNINERLSTFKSFNIAGTPIIQNGRFVGVLANVDESNPSKAYGYYAIDVYNEMMNIN